MTEFFISSLILLHIGTNVSSIIPSPWCACYMYDEQEDIACSFKYGNIQLHKRRDVEGHNTDKWYLAPLLTNKRALVKVHCAYTPGVKYHNVPNWWLEETGRRENE